MAGSRPSDDSIRFSHLLAPLSSLLASFSRSFSPYGDKMVMSISGLIIPPALLFLGEEGLLFPKRSSRSANTNTATSFRRGPQGQDHTLLSQARLGYHVRPESQRAWSAPGMPPGWRMRQKYHGAVTRRGRDDIGKNNYQCVLMSLSTTPFPIPRRVHLSLCSVLPAMTQLYSSTPFFFINLSSLPDWEFPVIPTNVCFPRAPAQDRFKLSTY